jgi:hypothetical protein
MGMVNKIIICFTKLLEGISSEVKGRNDSS